MVYSTHVYRNKGSHWDEAFATLAAEVPVVAGEWGGGDADVDWGKALAGYFAEHEIGWMAWGWPDRPPLIERGLHAHAVRRARAVPAQDGNADPARYYGNDQFFARANFVRIVEAVAIGLENLHILIRVAVELAADFRKRVSRFDLIFPAVLTAADACAGGLSFCSG